MYCLVISCLFTSTTHLAHQSIFHLGWSEKSPPEKAKTTTHHPNLENAQNEHSESNRSYKPIIESKSDRQHSAFFGLSRFRPTAFALQIRPIAMPRFDESISPHVCSLRFVIGTGFRCFQRSVHLSSLCR